MPFGYLLSPDENDSYMLGEETRSARTQKERRYYDWRFTLNGGPHPATCPTCGSKTDPDYMNPKFKLTRKTLDIGSTYDGYTIVSSRFRDFLLTTKSPGCDFRLLPSQEKHSWLRVTRVLRVDSQASAGIRFLYYCDTCRRYAGVFGTGGLRFEGIKGPVPKGIFRTDLEFAQAHEQSPCLIVDAELGAAMKAKRFKGLSLQALAD